MNLNKTPYYIKSRDAAGVSSAIISRFNNVVTLFLNGWTDISSISIPEGYRPTANTYFLAEQREGTSVIFDRLVVNANGTVTGSKTQVVGTFTWQIL